MSHEKDYSFGKSLIESNSSFHELFVRMTKVALAKAMGIHKATLENRKANIGTISVDEIINMADSLDVDAMKVAEKVIKERIAEREKLKRKGK